MKRMRTQALRYRALLVCLFAGLAVCAGPAAADLLERENALIRAIEDKDRAEFNLNLVNENRPTVRSFEGVPAIILAVETRDPFFVKGLLNAGARPDDQAQARRDDERTALTRAAELGNIHMVRALLKAGADPDLPGTRNESALIKAANLGHLRVVNALITAGADVTTTDMTGRTPMEVANRAGHIRIVDALRDAGADY